MTDFPFTDKYGRLTYCNTQDAFVREKGYIIIRKGNSILCHKSADMLALPAEKNVELKANPTAEFSVFSYITENGRPIKEMQTYRVYVVENVDLAQTALQWCTVDDILLEKVAFDATQIVGIKNLLVRVKEK